MRQLNERERRIIRWAAILLPCYLFIFYGMAGIRYLEGLRREYATLEYQANDVQIQITKELKKRKRLNRLREEWQLDLHQLDSSSLVSDARDAFHRAAAKCGVGLGNSSEVGRGGNADEIRTIHLQGSGKTNSVLRFLHLCPRLGFPLRLDNLQLKGVASKPGMLTATFTVAILNVDKWKGAAGA